MACSCNCIHCTQCPFKQTDATPRRRPPVTPPAQKTPSGSPATPKTPVQPKQLFVSTPKAPRKSAPKRVLPLPPRSRSARAGLVMPVSRVDHFLRDLTHGQQRLSPTAAVCMAAVGEYLVAEVLDAAVEEAQQANRKRLTPRHIKLGVEKDAELKELLAHTIIPGGGVLPQTPPKN